MLGRDVWRGHCATDLAEEEMADSFESAGYAECYPAHRIETIHPHARSDADDLDHLFPSCGTTLALWVRNHSDRDSLKRRGIEIPSPHERI